MSQISCYTTGYLFEQYVYFSMYLLNRTDSITVIAERIIQEPGEKKCSEKFLYFMQMNLKMHLP